MNLPLLDCPATERKTGGIWDYISPSRLNLWLRCPLAFKLRYLDGIRTPTTPALFLGTRVHDALEVFYRHRQLGAVDFGVEDATNRVSESWDEAVETESMKFESTKQADGLKQQAIDLVTVYLKQMADALETPLAVETSMEAPLVDPDTGEDLGIPLMGIVDLVTDDRDGSRIIDFKTSARSSPPHEITHEIQLTSYSYLFRQATGNEEGGLEIRSMVKTKTPKLDFHRYTTRRQQHFRRLFSVIQAYLDDLDSGRFVFRPGFGCIMCDHRDEHCQTWME